MISVEWSKRDSLPGGVALLRSTDYAPGPHSLRSISVVTFLGVRSELLLVVRSGSPQNPFWSIVFSSPPTATAFWISQLRYREIRDLILLYEHDGTVVSLSEYSTIAESYHQDGARAPAQCPRTTLLSSVSCRLALQTVSSSDLACTRSRVERSTTGGPATARSGTTQVRGE